MIKYQMVTDRISCLECREIYKIHQYNFFLDLRYTKRYFVAKDGDKIIGCMGINEPEKGVRKLNHLIVHPKYRKQGIGPIIIRKAIEHMKNDKDVTLIRNHKSTRVLFSKIFREEGFKRNYELPDNCFELHCGGK